MTDDGDIALKAIMVLVYDRTAAWYELMRHGEDFGSPEFDAASIALTDADKALTQTVQDALAYVGVIAILSEEELSGAMSPTLVATYEAEATRLREKLEVIR